MKSLLKIIRRYSLTAGLIITVILCSNVAAVLWLGYVTSSDLQKSQGSREIMEAAGAELIMREEAYQGQIARESAPQYSMTEHGLSLLESSNFIWAMALDLNGNTVWEWQLPSNIPHSYTIQDVASFSRWYLEDYPVRVWRYDELLLVFATDPEMESRHSIFMSLDFVRKMPFYLKVLFAINAGVIVLFILCFGWRFYKSLRPVVQGIEQLSQEQPLHLKEKGLAAEIAGKLNRTSEILQSQSRMLARRDEARTEWIAGVSHDIRTPLSLIVGYADRLAESESLNEEEKAMTRTIQRQSMIIRQLIQDLNLTSKLAYQSQPLKKTLCSPAHLLRECAADLYNEGLEQDYEIAVTVSERAEQVKIHADAGLLSRALRNLIGNSIRHNPQGCRIEAVLTASSGRIFCRVCDSGPGIPEQVVRNMDRSDSEIHIMGLRLTAQIAKAHGGVLVFRKRESGTYDAELICGPGQPQIPAD